MPAALVLFGLILLGLDFVVPDLNKAWALWSIHKADATLSFLGAGIADWGRLGKGLEFLTGLLTGIDIAGPEWLDGLGRDLKVRSRSVGSLVSAAVALAIIAGWWLTSDNAAIFAQLWRIPFSLFVTYAVYKGLRDSLDPKATSLVQGLASALRLPVGVAILRAFYACTLTVGFHFDILGG